MHERSTSAPMDVLKPIFSKTEGRPESADARGGREKEIVRPRQQGIAEPLGDRAVSTGQASDLRRSSIRFGYLRKVAYNNHVE